MGLESRSSKKAVRGEVIDNSNTCKNEPELRSLEWVQTGVGALWAWDITVSPHATRLILHIEYDTVGLFPNHAMGANLYSRLPPMHKAQKAFSFIK